MHLGDSFIQSNKGLYFMYRIMHSLGIEHTTLVLLAHALLYAKENLLASHVKYRN